MTQEEKAELRQVRIDLQIAKDKVHTIETDLHDNESRRDFLVYWKKGRWIGFVLPMFLCLFFWGVSYIYTEVMLASSLGRYENNADTVSYSVGATLIIILGALSILFLIVTIIMGILLVMEVGSSPFAKGMAKLFRRKNYPTEIKKCREARVLLQKSLMQVKTEVKELAQRLQTLEAIEDPWEGTY